MALVDPLALGLDAVRVIALLGLVRPDLVVKLPREQIRRLAVESLLLARRESALLEVDRAEQAV